MQNVPSASYVAFLDVPYLPLLVTLCMVHVFGRESGWPTTSHNHLWLRVKTWSHQSSMWKRRSHNLH